MNENTEIFDQEDILENTTYDENILSSDSDITLEDKIDHLEALINEDIALRGSDEGNLEELQEIDKYGTNIRSTSSGVDSNVDTPNYNQYIYDLLSDSTIKVELVEEQDITEKPLNDYSISDSLNVILIVLILLMFAYKFITEYVFKFKRR